MNEVWVFHGTGSHFANGIFTSQMQAEKYIAHYRLSGILTKYPVGLSAYDWALEKDVFQPHKQEHHEPSFIQRFTTPSQEHYHYEHGKRNS
jgi:hypothetical protein